MDIGLIEESAHAVEAATVARLLPARPRLLALGEPTHREELLLDVRNDLFRQLVEQDGYRIIALESDCLTGLAVDDYVTSGTGTLDEVVARGISHGWGASPGNRELVRWMRAYNDGRPSSEQLRFAGFDGPLEIEAAASPRQVLTALHGYLAARVEPALLPCAAGTLDQLIGADERWTDPAAAWEPSQSVGRSDDAKQLRLLADDLVALFDASLPHLIATSTPEELERARLYGRTATGLLRYHYGMADTSPARWARLASVRDTMMAENLLALAERGPTLVYAHNTHLQRDKGTLTMNDQPFDWWGAGALVSPRLGGDYAFLATDVGTISHHDVPAPPPDTLQGLLHQLPGDRHLIDTRHLTTTLPATPAPRESPYYGYIPLNPTHLPTYDGLLYIKDLPAA
ncbi:erythromycin esterase family protein [Nonomuraea fuscirosea]|uniref:erythromycin esterase family protein n=1 Tax=Nonomuraea fuscirosea TaxID=1291556 RepID=UPI0034354577